MTQPTITTLTLGELETNCYLVSHPVTAQTLIIDPADTGITEEIIAQQLKPTAVILTHAHFDHCLGLLEVVMNFDIPVYLHPKDTFLLEKAQQSAQYWLQKKVPPIPTETLPLTPDNQFNLDEIGFSIQETPGHTPGSITIILDDEVERKLFVGDVIFKNGVGRTDFSYANSMQLFNSIENLKAEYPGAECYAGHGELFYL